MILFDGTLWKDDEIIASNLGINKTGLRMGHLSMSGKEGTMELLKDLNIKKKFFIHINTTNPALLENSSERKELNEKGWEVSNDGMEVSL